MAGGGQEVLESISDGFWRERGFDGMADTIVEFVAFLDGACRALVAVGVLASDDVEPLTKANIDRILEGQVKAGRLTRFEVRQAHESGGGGFTRT